jgi:hypothetical protein
MWMGRWELGSGNVEVAFELTGSAEKKETGRGGGR